MARVASPAWPDPRPTPPMCMRRSRKAGSVPGFFESMAGRSGSCCRCRRARLRQGRRPTASRSGRNWQWRSRPVGAGARVRDPVRGPDVPRAGMRPRLVRCRSQESRARPRRAVALREPAAPWPILLGEASPPFKPARINAQFRMSAVASAGAITRPSRSMLPWRRCSSLAVRSGSPTIASSSSKAASSGMLSRCARRR